jgi:hypothetical protein
MIAVNNTGGINLHTKTFKPTFQTQRRETRKKKATKTTNKVGIELDKYFDTLFSAERMESEYDVSQFGTFTQEMRKEFHQSCAKFTATEEISLIIGSWNVNAKEEESQNLSKWLSDSDVQEADLVVVGLQEIIELSPTNTVIGSSFSGSSDNSSSISYNSCERWLSKLLVHLNKDSRYEQRSYVLLESLSMVGMAIFVFVRQDLKCRVGGVQARSISRGGGGILGNKGAVCVRFDINDTSFCFCSAHLCAHREDVLKRNEDFRVIYNTPVFQTPVFSAIQRLKSDAYRSSRNTSTATAAGHLKAKLKAKEGGSKVVVEDVYLLKVKVCVLFSSSRSSHSDYLHALITTAC